MQNFNKHISDIFVKRCPQSGRIIKFRFDTILAKILFPVVALIAITWFLVRVIPKPSRVLYPCQQIAAGIGGTYLLHILGLLTSMTIYQQIRKRVDKKTAIGFIASILFVTSLTVGVAVTEDETFIPDVTVTEGVNKPMGVAKGLFPGSWMQDFDATSWDGETGYWWEDRNTDPLRVKKMLSSTLQGLTGTKRDEAAWDKLFKYTNQKKGLGEKAYTKGEKVVIKLNINPTGKPEDEWTDRGYPNPTMVYAVISQLIEVAGVSGKDIILADPSRFIGAHIVDKIRANPSQEFQDVIIEVNNASGLKGYRTAEPDSITGLVWFNMPDGSRYKMCYPKSYTDASYIINYSMVRPHRVFGITSVAKNDFGAVWSFEKNIFNPSILHAFALWDYPTPNKMGDSHSAPVLLGHEIVNKKTVLYLADGLYTGLNQSKSIVRMSSFNDDWFSSLILSQDPVALESVIYDFISNEPNMINVNPSFNGNQENQFHECALAGEPPSGTKYDPENDGTGLQSLGVHEHWNNSTDRMYSRNLGTGEGIELLQIN